AGRGRGGRGAGLSAEGQTNMSNATYTGQAYIGGVWRAGRGTAFASVSPADGRAVWRGAAASQDDVDEAVAAARAALPAWRRTPLDERVALVRRFAKLVETRKADMAAAISRETGKPLWDAAT